MRFRGLFIIVALATIVVSGGCAERPLDGEQVDPGQKTVIRFSHVTAESSPKGLAAQRFADIVKHRTKGLVEVQVFADSTLYKDGEELEAVLAGNVEMIAPATSKLAEIAPAWQVLDLPYLFSSTGQLHRFLNGSQGAALYDDLRAQGLTPLAFWDNGFKQLTTSVRPLVYPEDCAGLSFRVMINNQVLISQFSLLNASPVPLPFNEVYDALNTGQINGQENTISNIYSKQLYTNQRHLTITNHGYLGYMVLVNTEFWNALPEETKSILVTVMNEVTTWERAEAVRINADNLAALAEDPNVSIHYQSAEERELWLAALAPAYSLLKHQIGADIVDAAVAAAEGGGD